MRAAPRPHAKRMVVPQIVSKVSEEVQSINIIKANLQNLRGVTELKFINLVSNPLRLTTRINRQYHSSDVSRSLLADGDSLYAPSYVHRRRIEFW